jgi:hypothetical protein
MARKLNQDGQEALKTNIMFLNRLRIFVSSRREAKKGPPRDTSQAQEKKKKEKENK